MANGLTVLPRTKTGLEAFVEAFTPQFQRGIEQQRATEIKEQDQINSLAEFLLDRDPDLLTDEAFDLAEEAITGQEGTRRDVLKVIEFNKLNDKKKQQLLDDPANSDFILRNREKLDVPTLGEEVAKEEITPFEKGEKTRETIKTGVSRFGEKVLGAATSAREFLGGLTGITPSPIALPALLPAQIMNLIGGGQQQPQPTAQLTPPAPQPAVQPRVVEPVSPQGGPPKKPQQTGGGFDLRDFFAQRGIFF